MKWFLKSCIFSHWCECCIATKNTNYTKQFSDYRMWKCDFQTKKWFTYVRHFVVYISNIRFSRQRWKSKTIMNNAWNIYNYRSQCESYIFRRNLRFRKIREIFVFEWYLKEFRQNSKQNSKISHIRCRRFVSKSEIDFLIAERLTNEYAIIRIFDISRFRQRFRISRKCVVFSCFQLIVLFSFEKFESQCSNDSLRFVSILIHFVFRINSNWS
jgi:hypothetical protein